MLLTRTEKDKFAAYLEQEAATAESLSKQMGAIQDILAKRLTNDVIAYSYVASKLREVYE